MTITREPEGAKDGQLDTLSTVLLLLVWPILILGLGYALALILTISTWLWIVVLTPIDLDWLVPLVKQASDREWWTLASTRIAGESPWVMPSALATTIGLCAAIYALPKPDRDTYARLALIAVLISSGASLWAWFSLASAFLSKNHNPVPAISTFAVATLIAILAALTGSFVRSPEARLDLLLARHDRLDSVLSRLTDPLRLIRKNRVLLRILVSLFAPAIVATAAMAPVLYADNQGGLGPFFIFNSAIGIFAWAISAAASWLVPARSRVARAITICLTLVGTAAAIVVPLLFGVQILDKFPSNPRVKMLSVIYVGWSMLIVVGNLPLTRSLLHLPRHNSPSGRLHGMVSFLMDWTAAGSVRDARIASERYNLNVVTTAIQRLNRAPRDRRRWSLKNLRNRT
ncbi:MAG: hypothetical protein JWR53_1034 [Glaciihabitans sp.]|nr:hypothetical protein [Glaciihabitans sp.]